MANKTLLPESLVQYVNEQVVRETDLQRKLRAATAALPEGMMQISPDQGAFLAFMVKLLDVRNAVEVGTFTGYSALAIATALPKDGKLICCDVSDEWTKIGAKYWREAGVADKITLHIAPATRTLHQLLESGAAGTIDLVFVDADKEAYDAYYEFALKLLKPNGLIILDNMLRHGAVADESSTDPGTVAIRDLSFKMRDDSRVDCSLVTIGDGFMLARKR